MLTTNVHRFLGLQSFWRVTAPSRGRVGLRFAKEWTVRERRYEIGYVGTNLQHSVLSTRSGEFVAEEWRRA